MNLFLSDPETLHALLQDPATPPHVLSCGAEVLGARWTPDRWWPTIKALLRHQNIVVREAAMIGLAGEQTEPDEPMGAAPQGFYEGRNWPADVGALRDEALAELDRVAREDIHAIIREIAAGHALQLRTGEKYPEEPDAQQAPASQEKTT
jgi:hypothetical protein